jgi:formate dehydrogenase subunit delta
VSATSAHPATSVEAANDATLVRMANQIAANVAYLPPPAAAAAVAAHLHSFWAPPMRDALQRIAEDEPAGLDPLVLAALEQPPPQP